MHVPVSVLLADKIYFAVFNSNFSEYLLKILNPDFYEPLVAQLPPGKSWKKTYQAEGQFLVRVSFRTEDILWGELSQLSHATGYSRCYLFAFLLDHYLKLSRTVVTKLRLKQPRWTLCILHMDERTKRMVRVLLTPTFLRVGSRRPRQGPSERPVERWARPRRGGAP